MTLKKAAKLEKKVKKHLHKCKKKIPIIMVEIKTHAPKHKEEYCISSMHIGLATRKDIPVYFQTHAIHLCAHGRRKIGPEKTISLHNLKKICVLKRTIAHAHHN